MSSVPILIIDTSIIGVSMAVADISKPVAESIVWKKIHPENMGSVPAIGSMLQTGLNQCGLDFKEILGVCVSSGPGSFTGIKVGLAFTYGLKLARTGGIPLLGISSLEAAWNVLAAEIGSRDLRLFLPATKTHGFVAADKDGLTCSALIDTGSPGFHLELGTSSNNSKNLIFRDWPLLSEVLRQRGKSSEIIDEIRMCNAALYGMAVTTKGSWPGGFSMDNPSPRYLRLSTAEEKLIADQAASADAQAGISGKIK